MFLLFSIKTSPFCAPFPVSPLLSVLSVLSVLSQCFPAGRAGRPPARLGVSRADAAPRRCRPVGGLVAPKAVELRNWWLRFGLAAGRASGDQRAAISSELHWKRKALRSARSLLCAAANCARRSTGTMRATLSNAPPAYLHTWTVRWRFLLALSACVFSAFCLCFSALYALRSCRQRLSCHSLRPNCAARDVAC